ncbi:spore germination protein [Jeotgalibacillus marinus]|uniref:Spore germination protein n=1 Tax=Jeotgalibacillus marinus TaxID=86667 RepID=A0ABV3Q3T5_9BACL
MSLLRMVHKLTQKKQPKKVPPAPLRKKKEFVTLQAIKEKLGDIDDVVYQKIRTSEGIATIIYYRSLIEQEILLQMVINPLLQQEETIVHSTEPLDKEDLSNVISLLTQGFTIVFIHKENVFFSLNTVSMPQRSISISDKESSVIGPQDFFTEVMDTNLSLVKRRIHSSTLKSKNYTIGAESNTKVSVLYLDNIVNKENLDKVITKVEENKDYTDFYDVSILMQLMEDQPLSPFPQYNMTIRADLVTKYLLDGRVVVMMDNSPEAIICPTSFFELFVPTEDYYNRWTSSSLLRMLRFFGFFVTIILTPTYISALTFHPELMPFEVLVNLQESRERVPFPPVIEVLFIELVIEILREAGSRMPAKIGQTIGIVGGIVIGTAAVEAGLISNVLVVLVAISALLSFLPPNYLISNTSRFIRYVFILSAGMFGMYGQMAAFALLFIHLLNLTSLGTPYMTPGIPRTWSDLLDNVVRAPISLLRFKKGMSRSHQNKIRPLDEE